MKWHIRLNPKKTKSTAVSRSRSNAPGYGDLTLGSAELEQVRSLRILEVPLDSMLTFEAHLWEVVLKAAKSLGILLRAEKLLDCARVLKSCFNAFFAA